MLGGRATGPALSLTRCVRRSGHPVTPEFGRSATTDGQGGWQGSRATQVMFLLDLEHTLKKLDDGLFAGLSRIGFIATGSNLSTPWRKLDAGSAVTSVACGHWVMSNTKRRTCRERSGTFVRQSLEETLGDLLTWYLARRPLRSTPQASSEVSLHWCRHRLRRCW